MGYLPLFLNLEGSCCLIVGGGNVALRKARTLLEAGARVLVISPQFDAGFGPLAHDYPQQLAIESRPYESPDLSGFQLIFAATDQEAVNARVSAEARRAGVWVNVADDPARCTALAGAVLQRGSLQIAVSTGGECPALAAAIRDELSEAYSEWTGVYAAALGHVRHALNASCADSKKRTAILRHLAGQGIREGFHGLPLEELKQRLAEEAERMR